MGRSAAIVLFCSAAAGCMISEQSGEMPQDLAFYFDTDFNRILVFGRSALLAGLGLWIVHAWKQSAGALLVAAGLVGAAGWWIWRDYDELKQFRVEVLTSGLYASIPPEPERRFAWESIQEMRIVGVEWADISRQGPGPRYAWDQLPEWQAMELTLAGGETYRMNLEPLSIEQRQTLWRAVARRANLVEMN